MTPRAEITKPGLRGFLQDTDGGTAMMFALVLTVVLGAAALAVDYARAITSRQLLASAADAAVLAAVSGLPDEGAVRQIALDYVEKNLPADKFGKALSASDIEFGTWDAECGEFRPTSGGGDGDDDDDDDDDFDQAGSTSASGSASSCKAAAPNFGVAPTAVRLTTRMAPSNGNELDTLFAWVFGRASMEVSASAVAGRGGPPCVLALDPTMSPAMLLDSNAEIETIGCAVQVNSTATGALRIDSNGSLRSTDICVGGTAQLPGSGEVSPEPNEFCPGRSDPMAGLAPPAFGGCDHHNASYVDSNAMLFPGVYCGGLEIDGNSNVTFSAGTYVIQDGPLNVLSNSSITGSEVTIFLTGKDSVLFFDSNSSIALTAPVGGAFEGILFFQDPNSGGVHRWNGNSTTTLRGVIYLPSGKLEAENANKITPMESCTVLIANAIEFNSNSGVSIDITQSSCRSFLPSPYSRGIVLLQ